MSLHPHFCRDLVAEWNRCHSAFYRVRETDLVWHRESQSWLSYFSADAEGVALLCAVATETGAREGLSAKTLWVSLHGEVPKGRESRFVAALGALAPSCGKTRLAMGGEEFHLVAGVPGPLAASYGVYLEDAGFRLAEASDFAGPLSGEPLLGYIREAEGAALSGEWTLRPASSQAELGELGEFLRREFPGRWEREFRFWKDREDTRRAFWNLLRQGGKEVVGFSRLALRGREEGGWLPGALRLPLADAGGDEYTDACLGPIGLAPSQRGKGAGKILLGLSLQLLLAQGANRVCIDWTNAYNYYKPLGLQAVRTYWSAWKDC